MPRPSLTAAAGLLALGGLLATPGVASASPIGPPALSGAYSLTLTARWSSWQRPGNTYWVLSRFSPGGGGTATATWSTDDVADESVALRPSGGRLSGTGGPFRDVCFDQDGNITVEGAYRLTDALTVTPTASASGTVSAFTGTLRQRKVRTAAGQAGGCPRQYSVTWDVTATRVGD